MMTSLNSIWYLPFRIWHVWDKRSYLKFPSHSIASLLKSPQTERVKNRIGNETNATIKLKRGNHQVLHANILGQRRNIPASVIFTLMSPFRPVIKKSTRFTCFTTETVEFMSYKPKKCHVFTFNFFFPCTRMIQNPSEISTGDTVT